MEYQITQGEIITKWQEITQQPDTYGEGVIAAVRLARWVERRLAEKPMLNTSTSKRNSAPNPK
jgi:hypothetical protein